MEMNQNHDDNGQLNLPHLPHDLIGQEILSRLPIKAIYRFQAVCKCWRSLLNGPKFIELHQWRALRSPNGIVMSFKYEEDNGHALISFYSIDISETGKVTKLMFTFPLDVDIYSMAPSLNGLVCFSALLTKKIYVCNPSTHELLQLPEVAGSEVAGFGYDYRTGTYNVLCVRVGADYLAKNWFLLSLGSVNNGWRRLDRIPRCRIQPKQNAFLNEAVYWVTQDPDHSYPDGLLSFDFFDHRFRVRSLPNCPSWESYLQSPELHAAMHLKVMGGQLHLITTLDESQSGYWTLSFWTLKDDIKFDWTFDFTFRIEILSCQMRLFMPVPVIIRDGQVYFSSGSELYRHDVEKVITKKMSDGIPVEDNAEVIKSYQSNYSESSTPINHRHDYPFV